MRIQLQHPDGSLWKWIGASELTTLQDKGHVTRISGRRDAVVVYRMKILMEPSESRMSVATVTLSDMRAVAGEHRVNDVWIERLVGLGLLTEGTSVPAGGFFNAVQ